MRREVSGALGFLVALGALLVVGAVLGPRLLKSSAGPENELLTTLKEAERAGLSVPISGRGEPLASTAVHFDRTTTALSDDGTQAELVFTLDFTGKLGDIQVSALGRERVLARFGHGHWEPEGKAGWVPTLAAAVQALSERQAALERGDLGALRALVMPGTEAAALASPALHGVLDLTNRRYRARTWYLRAEREGVVVSEDYRLEGNLPDRPVDEVGGRRLRLAPAGQRLLFADGLM